MMLSHIRLIVRSMLFIFSSVIDARVWQLVSPSWFKL